MIFPEKFMISQLSKNFMNSPSETIENKSKHIIFILFVTILFLPLIQTIFPTIIERPLDGVDPTSALPAINADSWFNEEYQKDYLPAFEQTIGFHNSLVRLRNQINYSLFGFADVGDVVVGKGNYIFLKPYINAYTGADYVGKEYIQLQSQKIKTVQEELKKKNIDLFIVFAPGKGSFYPEYIPENYKTNMQPDSTNYACYKKMFTEYGINNLDLRAYFSSIKSTEKYPLYSNTGVHWTEYGSYLAALEIAKYISKIKKIQLPKIELQSLKVYSFTRNTDYDAASLMNLFATIPQPKVAIPQLHFVSGQSTKKPRFLCISDSYFHGIIHSHIPANVFTDYHDWHYYDRVYPESFVKEKKVDKKNLRKEIEKQDVICILVTDASLSAFPFGFIDDAYELYAKKDTAYYRLKEKEFCVYILKTIENIKNNKDWEKNLVENAKRKKTKPIDEFYINAVWLYEQEQLNILKVKNE